MENQIVNPEPKAQLIIRNEDGTFANGSCPNPNGSGKGLMRFDIRVNYWLDMNDKELNDKVENAGGVVGLSQRDQMCIDLIKTGKTAAPADKVRIFKALSERVDGTPVQTIVIPDNPFPRPVGEMNEEEAMKLYEQENKR